MNIVSNFFSLFCKNVNKFYYLKKNYITGRRPQERKDKSNKQKKKIKKRKIKIYYSGISSIFNFCSLAYVLRNKATNKMLKQIQLKSYVYNSI